MRTVYLGTSEFAADVLERLSRSPHRPVLVLSRPDRPRGRGRRLEAPPVAQAARRLDLRCEQPESVNGPQALEMIAAAAPEVVVVCAFGALIKKPLLSSYPILNVHPSLLPRWRGAAPIERAIMAGDLETGVSIMRLTAGLDSGPIALQSAIPISAGDSFATLSERLQELGGRLLIDALSGSPSFWEQSDEGVTYAEKIEAADRRLDPARPAVELERVVRALHPHIGAQLWLAEAEPLGVLEARAEPTPEGLAHAAGELLPGDGSPRLACAPGHLALLRVKPAGRGEMSGSDWLRGRRR